MIFDKKTNVAFTYFDRDLSWLSFNGRVLEEAASPDVPLMERIRFLSIYSSNLDEFYRVRIPSLMALEKIQKQKNREAAKEVLQKATGTIAGQLERFGHLLRHELIPQLQQHNISFLYDQPIPESILARLEEYFYTQLLASLHCIRLQKAGDFFPESNSIYLLFAERGVADNLWLVNIPVEPLSRFYSITEGNTRYIVFIDDIIRRFLPGAWEGRLQPAAFSFKITRDADLDLQDEFEGDLADKIEKQIIRRDMGFATRLLFDPAIPAEWLEKLIRFFSLQRASIMPGGRYHNLRDLAQIPISDPCLSYPSWPAKKLSLPASTSLLDYLRYRDLLLHPPYQDYGTVLRFFNEAAASPQVREIWATLYRIAGDSRIATALISAARNGKLVTVFVELKARFDEANNIRWARKMKAAGVRIIYSIPGLKVHAKIALVKLQEGHRMRYAGIFATGNFNERTARFYTDHVLLTTRPALLQELELLFLFLAKRRKPRHSSEIRFTELAVAQFNLRDHFIQLIEQEKKNAREGKKALIRIKLNNLEDTGMIDELYAASQAGVHIELLVRGICRLVPGAEDISEKIKVKRIVDRYLEHGRIFHFYNDGKPAILAGSADWMERNIHRRIEVCFPVYDPMHMEELLALLDMQWADNTQAVWIHDSLTMTPVRNNNTPVRSQEAIWKKLQSDA